MGKLEFYYCRGKRGGRPMIGEFKRNLVNSSLRSVERLSGAA